MSAGTANPATCPMWRGALAYGQAGATRIFCGDGDSDTGGHDTSRSERDRSRGGRKGRGEPPAGESSRPPAVSGRSSGSRGSPAMTRCVGASATRASLLRDRSGATWSTRAEPVGAAPPSGDDASRASAAAWARSLGSTAPRAASAIPCAETSPADAGSVATDRSEVRAVTSRSAADPSTAVVDAGVTAASAEATELGYLHGLRRRRRRRGSGTPPAAGSRPRSA